MIGYTKLYNDFSENQNLPSVLSFGDRPVKIINTGYFGIYESIFYDLKQEDAYGFIAIRKLNLISLLNYSVFDKDSEIHLYNEIASSSIKVGGHVKLLYNGTTYSSDALIKIPQGSRAVLKKIEAIEDYDLFYLTITTIVNLTTPQINITGATSLDSSFTNAIVKVKANAIITIPPGNTLGFNCVFDCHDGFTGTFVAGPGVAINAPNGLVMTQNKSASLYKDDATDKYRLLIS